MNASQFVRAMTSIRLENVFNPYADHCDVYDALDAPASRRRNLRTYLESANALGVDTIWMGRDLGHRGGRRTGLALTDEKHLPEVTLRYPGTEAKRATIGPIIAERTAAEIWAFLPRIKLPPLLWNVFPFHPHEPGNPFTNRKFSARELAIAEDLNAALIQWLGIRRIVAIGEDAAEYARRFGITVEKVRHPSYGGVRDFRAGIANMYELHEPYAASTPLKQTALF